MALLGYDPVPNEHAIADRLLAVRRRRGLSQRELAVELGVDPGTRSSWELGIRVPRARFADVVDAILTRAGSAMSGASRQRILRIDGPLVGFHVNASRSAGSTPLGDSRGLRCRGRPKIPNRAEFAVEFSNNSCEMCEPPAQGLFSA